MTINRPASSQIKALHDIEELLSSQKHEDDRELLNRAIFGVSNRLGIHPNDLAIYIITRTASI